MMENSTIQTKTTSNLYYNWNDILSKDRMFNFVVGIRGGGKTYGATKLAITRYLKQGRKTIWLRRYASELGTEFRTKYFSDMILNNEFPEHELQVKATDIDGIAKGYIKAKDGKKWEDFILFMPLSIALKNKSIPFNEYDLVFFDEFLIDTTKSNLQYLSGWNEPTIFFEFFESVVRTRENIKCVFIGNAIATINPYFVELKIRFDKEKEWMLDKYTCIHNYKNKDFKEFKQQSTWGKFLSTTRYGAYNMDNEFVNENDDFIEDRPIDSRYAFGIHYMGKNYGVWDDADSGSIYITKQYDKQQVTYAFTTKDMKPNMVVLENNSYIKQLLKQYFRYGCVRYADQEIKQMFLEIIQLMRI